MLGTQKYNHDIDILYKAYTEGTLMHGNCAACVVGNLIAHALGYVLTNDLDWANSSPAWVFILIGDNVYSENKEVARQVDSTGYTLMDVIRIEYAFENASSLSPTDDWELNGLLAVVDVLKDIHSTDGVVAKKRFMELA